MSTIRFTFTTFTHGRTDRPAVSVDFDDIEALLGRPHRGTPEDDEAIVAALLATGAPAWVETAEGALDGCWCLLGPALDGSLQPLKGDTLGEMVEPRTEGPFPIDSLQPGESRAVAVWPSPAAVVESIHFECERGEDLSIESVRIAESEFLESGAQKIHPGPVPDVLVRVRAGATLPLNLTVRNIGTAVLSAVVVLRVRPQESRPVTS